MRPIGLRLSLRRQGPQGARKYITEGRRTSASPQEQRRLLEAFVNAAQKGDVAMLESLFAEDVVSYSDGGGVVRTAARAPVSGRGRVAKFYASFAGHFWVGVTVSWIETNVDYETQQARCDPGRQAEHSVNRDALSSALTKTASEIHRAFQGNRFGSARRGSLRAILHDPRSTMPRGACCAVRSQPAMGSIPSIRSGAASRWRR